ncbi:MAG: hypothetical protein U0165_17050 [Polyangiaceae bacterium]
MACRLHIIQLAEAKTQAALTGLVESVVSVLRFDLGGGTQGFDSPRLHLAVEVYRYGSAIDL